ncbi:hypothetical protein BDW02DRAFT_633634 [Decorospora gaudefroyi]|uniref:Uncharacterized protein n=1 Tax=Decorospora gaudefroyi TaxID=184978 RepID=A0A6A5JZL4_9PLEO|nr:hypothetical protein BDW02DRAFT_633634 [Decorospora gaudefroyi]
MEKIKSVLHGHKKEGDVAHDSHTSPSTAAGQQHPIYDQMTGQQSEGGGPHSHVKTTSGEPYTELAQPLGSPGLHGHGAHGKPELFNNDGPMPSSTTTTSDPYTNRPMHTTGAAAGSHRPDAYPHGHTQEASAASIKSGIIGFGSQAQQGHATIPRHIGEQQPYENTMRQESYTADTDRAFPLAGGIVSRPHEDPTSSSTYPTEHTSTFHNRGIGEREPGTKEKEVGIDDSPSRAGHAREGLAGAAAAATAVGVSKTLSRSETRDVQDQARETRQATYGDVPPASMQTGNTSSETTTTPNFPSATPSQQHGTEDRTLPGTSHTGGASSLLGPSTTGERPANPRLESHQIHIPGAFVATPSDESKTFLNYTPVIASASDDANRQTPIAEPTSTLDPSTGRDSHGDAEADSKHHELRHTGTLDEPQPRSPGDHGFGRDAAVAGGLGAAGLGAHEASQRHETPEPSNNKSLYEESSPYSSKALDPRVLGDKAKMDEQKFDPRAKTSDPASRSAISGPPVSHLPSHDTAAPISNTPHRESNFSEAIPTSGASVPQQRSTGKDHFYGTPGAPGPIADTSMQQQDSSAVPESHPQHHYGRDAGLAGAATAGGMYAANRDNKQESGPASNNTGTYASDVPSEQRGYTTTGQRVDEKAEQPGQHHYGRDAAAVGGSGAAGYGAYEAVKAYGDHRMTQPGASLPEQRYDPTASSARAHNPISSRSQYDYNDSAIQSNVHRTDPNDHVNRNAALGGAGLGAASAGAYAGSRHHEDTQQLPLHQNQNLASSGQPGSIGQPSHPTQGTQSSYPLQETGSYPAQGTIAPHNTHTQEHTIGRPYESMPPPMEESHDKRNAAVLGGAVGAAGLGGAAYVDSQHQDEREAEERLRKIAHEREKEHHGLDKEQYKHDKSVAAAHEKEEHRLMKEREKDEHRLMKEHEKEQARLAKEQHQREKEIERENEGDEKKKGGLLGFLHRDKSKKEKSTSSPETSPRQSKDYSPRHSVEESNPDSPRWKGKTRLHKDPPKGHPAREAMEYQQASDYGHSGKREHTGVDGPIGDPNMISGDRETQRGVYGAHPASDLEHNTSVTDPHTGLPMNTRYGTGAGGTDGNPAIHGQHTHPGAGQSTTDWEAIRKGDTLY